jgi:uncharacterized membrane protein YhfC
MAVNPFLMLSGIGMIAVAILAILYWRHKTGTDARFFMAGAGIWLIAIAIKIVLDLSITAPLEQWMMAAGGLSGLIVGASIYVGLRTGIIESGFSYIAVIKTWLKKMTFNQAVALGIGFGTVEAILVGFSSFLNILVFVLMPEIIATIPAELQPTLIQQLSASTLMVFPAIIERIAAISIHVFSSVLVVYAVRSSKLKYLAYSIIFKAVVDGILPSLVFALDPATSLAGAYLIEVPIIILGVIGFYGTKWLKLKKW